MFHLGVVANVVGILLLMLGGFMLVPFPFLFFFDIPIHNQALLYASLVTIFMGLTIWYLSRKSKKNIQKREGFLIVVVGWVTVSAFSALPYWFGDILPEITDALFESVSGLTTTGASVIDDVEAVPKSILLWRSFTQWLGGMGIIVLTVAIFPLLGIGGIELFVAETPGPRSNKIHPRIKEAAKRLWFIYLGLTVSLAVILFGCGMNSFDAINHALTTMATGGFSTKNASIAYFEAPVIHYFITLFMFIAGINYSVIYFGLKGNFKKVFGSDEFRTYLFFVVVLILVVTLVVFNVTNQSLGQSFRESAFQIISIITTTGFVSTDYTSWTPFLTILFFVLLFVGACAGSTSGGVKIIRHLVFFKNSLLELKRLLHPKGIIRIKIDKKVVTPHILTHILVFLLLYMMLFIAGSLIMAIILSDFKQPLLTSIGAVATSLGNVGPSIAELGPLNNFTGVPTLGKWVLVLLMLLGRLELFTILIVLSPYFWKKN